MASTLIAAMAVVGFWPTFLQPLFTGVSEAGMWRVFTARLVTLFMQDAAAQRPGRARP